MPRPELLAGLRCRDLITQVGNDGFTYNLNISCPSLHSVITTPAFLRPDRTAKICAELPLMQQIRKPVLSLLVVLL